MEEAILIQLITTNVRNPVTTFPYVQDFSIERRFLMSHGEGLDGPFATTWRPSFDIITLTCVHPVNYNEGDTFMDIIDTLEPLSKITKMNQDYSILQATWYSKMVFRYHVIPISHSIQRSADNLVVNGSFSFVGSKTKIALNSYLMFSQTGRTNIPITSGKFQV